MLVNGVERDAVLRKKVLELLEGHRLRGATIRRNGGRQATTVGHADTGPTIYSICGSDSQTVA